MTVTTHPPIAHLHTVLDFMAYKQQRFSLINCLVRVLSVEENSGLHKSAARAVAIFAVPETGNLIAATEGVVEGLVRLLSETGSEGVRREATRALAQLAKLDDFRVPIARSPDALHNLVQLLRANNNFVQEWVI